MTDGAKIGLIGVGIVAVLAGGYYIATHVKVNASLGLGGAGGLLSSLEHGTGIGTGGGAKGTTTSTGGAPGAGPDGEENDDDDDEGDGED